MAGYGDWSEIAEWWDDKVGEDGGLWHRELINPTMLDVLGPVEGLEILDLACGNGYHSRGFARNGASRVVGVDASEPIIRLARERTGKAKLDITFHVADAGALSMLGDAGFDVVFSNMAMMDIPNADQAIAEASRVLRPGGRLIFSIMHPCFETLGNSAWSLEKIAGSPRRLFRKVSRYREVHTIPMPWRLDGEQLVETPSYHRPLPWYVTQLRKSHFVVTHFEEPYPTDAFREEEDDGDWIAEIPLQCVIGAEKR